MKVLMMEKNSAMDLVVAIKDPTTLGLFHAFVVEEPHGIGDGYEIEPDGQIRVNVLMSLRRQE